MTPETQIKRAICQWLVYNKALIFTHDSVGIYDAKKGIWRSNRDPYRRNGVSDILGIWRGKFLAIEVKTEKNYPSKEQKLFIADVIKHGGIAFIARSIDDVRRGLSVNTSEKDFE